MKTWSCKIGEIEKDRLPENGASSPMRAAVRTAYMNLTNQEPNFIFCGWAAELTEAERAVHEDREPDPVKVAWEHLDNTKAAWNAQVYMLTQAVQCAKDMVYKSPPQARRILQKALDAVEAMKKR